MNENTRRKFQDFLGLYLVERVICKVFMTILLQNDNLMNLIKYNAQSITKIHYPPFIIIPHD